MSLACTRSVQRRSLSSPTNVRFLKIIFSNSRNNIVRIYLQMMDLTNIKDIEELVICNLCKQKFNHIDSVPKLLTCKHYFCLSCIRSTMMKGMEVFCVNCWKRTELEEQDPEVLPTYNPILVLSTSLSNIKNSINGGNNVTTVNHETLPPDKDKKVCSFNIFYFRHLIVRKLERRRIIDFLPCKGEQGVD